MASSLIAPIAGAALGGLVGGKSKAQTKTTSITMPESYKKGYESLLEAATKQYSTPIQGVEKRRIEDPTNAYDSLFTSPELLNIQRSNDARLATARGQLDPRQEKIRSLGYTGEFAPSGTVAAGELGPADKWMMENYGSTDWQGNLTPIQKANAVAPVQQVFDKPALLNRALGGFNPKGNALYMAFMNNAPDEGWAELAKAIEGGQHTKYGGFIKDGKMVDIGSIISKYSGG